MSITIVVSPSATGKTSQCIHRLKQVLADNPLAPVWIVLPDRLQAVAFRRRLAAVGGAIGVHIGTFGDLYHSILFRADQPIPVASDTVIYRLIKTSIRDVAAQGKLVHYTPIADKPGFISAIRDRFAELKRARVLPEDLIETAKKHDTSLAELGLLYADYQAKLQAMGWADPEGVNWLAVEELERDPAVASEIRLLIVDGFDSFNGSQFAALRLLSERIPELIITLPGTLGMERTAHRRFARSLEMIKTELPDAAEEEVSGPMHLPGPLANLERGIFEPAPTPTEGQPGISFVETCSPVDEAREALRWVKARIIRDGLRLDECALVTPDPERYRQHLREAGEEFGVPLRFTHGEALTSAPGIAALLDLLELPSQGWPRRLTIEALRAPYFDLTQFNLDTQKADLLELVSQFGQVVGGLGQWRESLERLALMEQPPPTEEGGDLPAPMLPHGEAAASLWENLKAFSDRLALPDTGPTRTWVEWLEDLLDELYFFERQETDRDEASAIGLRGALRALVLGEEVSGEAPMEYEAFLKELRSTLEGTNFQERLEWSHPAVLVLRVLEARGLRFKAVVVLGLSEGLFPEVEREDPFLSEELRAELGLEPRLQREQGGLFYQAVTRSDRFLLLTRPTMAEDGERWEPSPFWTSARLLFTDEPVVVRPDAPRALADAASAEEVLFLAVRKGGLPRSYTDLTQRFEGLRLARDVLEARLGDDGTSPFEGDLSDVEEALREYFGPDHIWSPSRLETYGTCPHWFYAAHVLQLEPREPPEFGYNPRQLGSILHAILEKAYMRAEDPGDVDSVLAALEVVAPEEFQAAPERFGFRPSPLWDVEQEHLLEKLTETVTGIVELEDGWTPVAFERVFGLEGVPPLVMEIDGQKVQLHGVIDRVDKNESGELRILDYKSGSSHLGPQDLVEGRRLQLPIYALGAREALEMGEPVEGLYWAILAGRRGWLTLSRFSYEEGEETYKGPDAAFRMATRHVRRILEGVRAGVFPPIPPRGGCPSYCPAAAWCWRYDPAFW